MSDPARFLGFAFANADFLFEVDRDGKIAFAAGAAHDFLRDPKMKLVGQSVGRLFQPTETVKFTTLTRALGAGDRAGPYKFKLANGADALLALFRLPENGGMVSCTLAKPGARKIATTGKDARTGLSDREGFLAAAGLLAGHNEELALVSVPALDQLSTKLPPAEAEKLLARIGDVIRSTGPKAAGRLSDNSFGVIAQAAGSQNQLGQTIRKALLEGGMGSVEISEALVSLKTGSLGPDQRMLALRYVVDRFADDAEAPVGKDLSATFDQLMKVTQARALKLTQTVAEGAFSLAYQPIIDLRTGAVSHFEALARFSDEGSTGEIIGFAEALGIADAFDLAVAIKVLAYLTTPECGIARIAFNISGRTLASPPAFGLLAGFLARNRPLASRILIEITETAEIGDIAAANTAIQTIREMGFKVGLDDFGAGAASLQYLHGFAVDFVKLDGALVKKLGTSARDDTLLRGIVKLCAELGVQTIAECIENEDLLARAKEAGFDFGQGHQFGHPTATPSAKALEAGAVRAKRQGVRESWG
jgi:EAL domain-containing protein (putative c-di-GMP-specific phosphodiesterase class I)